MTDLNYNELGELKEEVKKLHKLRKELKRNFPNHMGADEFLKMNSGKMSPKEEDYWQLHMKACPCCKATYEASLEDELELEEILTSADLIDQLNKEELRAIMASC